MFPSETSSCNAMETEESTAEGEPVSPTKKVTFDDDDGDDDDGVNGDRDGDDGDVDLKLDEENNEAVGDDRKHLFQRQRSVLADDVTSNYDNYDDVFKLSRNYDDDHDDGSNAAPVSHV